jgi:SAM-dependent MidA family methyltransferase
MDINSNPDCKSSPLDGIMHQIIQKAGGICFADFMHQVLYHPTYGYYMSSREKIGKQGDFFTSSSVNPLYGRLIARQLAEMAQLLPGKRFELVEQGGGEGFLALDILDTFAAEFPSEYERLRYTLIELSPHHRLRQSTRLKHHLGKLDWAEEGNWHIESGCFLSNELVDAFPVHVVEKQSGQIWELFVKSDGKTFLEDLRVETCEGIKEYFKWLGVEPVDGNRGEVNLLAVQWMKNLGQRITKGFVLTVDYGYTSQELYAPFRRNGTLMCYSKHQADEKPFEHVGEKDITTHVDFSALEKAGQESGLVPLWLGEQYRFLLGLGFVEELIKMEAQAQNDNEARALRLTLKNLIMPEAGMGETFKILIQGKDVGTPELQCNRPINHIPMV